MHGAIIHLGNILVLERGPQQCLAPFGGHRDAQIREVGLAALGDASVPRLIPGPGGWRLETEPEAAAPSGGLFGLGLLIAAIALGYALVSLVKGGSGG